MDEPKTDLENEQSERDRASEDARVAGRPIWMLACSGVILFVIVLWLFIAESRRLDLNTTDNQSEIVQAYHLTLAETRTGPRLLRLEDFIANHPQNRYVLSARVQRAALKMHEETAWASLSDRYYDLETDDNARQSAIDQYTSAWGTLIRSKQLQELNATLPNDAIADLNTEQPISRFAQGGEDRFLAGQPNGRRSTDVRIYKPEPNRRRISSEARVRSTQDALYPRKAYRRRINATVTLSLTIDKRGRVADVDLVSVRARRYERDFVRAAEKAARGSRFYPKKVNGKSVTKRGYIRKYTFQHPGT